MLISSVIIQRIGSLERPIWRCFMKLGTAVRGNGRDLHFSKDPNVSGFSWSEYSIELGKIY
ncbi:hypothetical protein V1477_001388 [Vespula maculifrons]|uniref:Uncharacterized protein n=1 Tax=Vespula maculifrons TaxID=7453 RepID=A0ABD2CZ34_VESMC